jgi:hypothetical protein
VVLKEIINRTNGEPIADVGEEFQRTDIKTGDLPKRRFVLGGRSNHAPDFWVVCYEHGGMFYHYHVVALAVEGEEAKVLKAGQWYPEELTLKFDQVLAAIRNGEVKDDNHY